MALEKYLPKKSLRAYMAQYSEEHRHIGTKITHMIGIPMIVASLPTAIVSPPIAGALFTGGWILQFIGHGVFEKSKPSFVSDPYYLLVGAVWVGVEYAHLLGLKVPEALTPQAPEAGAPVSGEYAAAAQ